MSYEDLSEYFKDRRKNSDYLIDGIIVNNNQKHKRTKKGNPKYAFAFKDVLEVQMAFATIKNIEWNASKDGYLNPVVNLEPVELGGVTIKRVTAYNAKFVKDNSLGKGAIVKIIRSGDVIPYIMGVISPSKDGKWQQPPLDVGKWKWTNSGVDIELEDKSNNKNVMIKELVNFSKTFSALNFFKSLTCIALNFSLSMLTL